MIKALREKGWRCNGQTEPGYACTRPDEAIRDYPKWRVPVKSRRPLTASRRRSSGGQREGETRLAEATGDSEAEVTIGVLNTGAVRWRVTDQSQSVDDAEESESEENEEEEFELEGLMTRERGAAVLRRLADGVENASVELGGDEGAVAVPEQFEVEVEYEEGEDEAELEVELEWSMVDGEAVSAGNESEEDESDGTEETETSEKEADDEE